MIARTLGLTLGLIVGLTVTTIAQQAIPDRVTVSYGGAIRVECKAPATLTIAVDNGTAMQANTMWSPSPQGTFIGLIAFQSMPAEARAIGRHTLTITNPPITVLLADGLTPYTYPGGSFTREIETLPDVPPADPPIFLGWARSLAGLLYAFQ